MKIFRRKKEKIKVIKKSTWHRNFKAFCLRLDRRQRERSTIPDVDVTMRHCINCGCDYAGRYCPQCCQAGTWDRYTWKQAFLNFLDIWGLGNRPMFRTIKELFWRPGYMVRDYLSGHRQFYFPPFKLLAVMAILTMFVYFVTGQEQVSMYSGLGELIDRLTLPSFLMSLMPLFKRFLDLLSNPLYETIFTTIILVCFFRFAFRGIGGYNIIEIFIFLIYLESLDLMIKMIYPLFTGICHLVNQHLLFPLKFSSPAVYSSLYAAGSWLATLLSILLFISFLLILLAAFKQFFQLPWKSTIKRLLFAYFVIIMALITILFLAFTAYKKGVIYFVLALFLSAVALTACYYAFLYIRRNKANVSRFVYHFSVIVGIVSFLTMFLLFIFFISDGFESEKIEISISGPDFDNPQNLALWIINYCVGCAISFLSATCLVFLYKKYYHKSIAFLTNKWHHIKRI